LDNLDVAILRELTQARMILPGRPGITPSNREVSRRLNLPPGTVRYRLKRLYESGVLEGSSVFPNPSLLGLKIGAYTVDVSPLELKREVVHKLLKVEGAVHLHNFVGNLLWMTFVYQNEKEPASKVSLMNEIAGAEGIFSRIPYPPCVASLAQSEADLVLRLARGGFDTYGSLAKELGVSVRTLERRLSKLVGEGVVLSLPKVNYKAMTGCVPADLLVIFRDANSAKSSEGKIMQLVADKVILAALWDVIGMCSLILPNVSAIGELNDQVRVLEGVATARVEIVRDHIEPMDVFRNYLEKWMEQRSLKVLSPALRS
jgi:DNA-binding Lrp family transcriptional regulator